MDYIPRKIKFKAWDKENKLLMRLNSIQCNKGELFKKNHILLQFSGFTDHEGEELYEMDVVFIDYKKFVICWQNGWFYAPIENIDSLEVLVKAKTESMRRFCSYFELEGQPV
ncbi:MAG: hypothetical protein HC811_08310 [Flammeovirgaceae bacterium]|nr:hypothetical protein [Flammeovirgaceae bacterium]